LNKNKEYQDQIEYKILTMTCGMILIWHVNIFLTEKKLKKLRKKKPRNDTCLS